MDSRCCYCKRSLPPKPIEHQCKLHRSHTKCHSKAISAGRVPKCHQVLCAPEFCSFLTKIHDEVYVHKAAIERVQVLEDVKRIMEAFEEYCTQRQEGPYFVRISDEEKKENITVHQSQQLKTDTRESGQNLKEVHFLQLLLKKSSKSEKVLEMPNLSDSTCFIYDFGGRKVFFELESEVWKCPDIWNFVAVDFLLQETLLLDQGKEDQLDHQVHWREFENLLEKLELPDIELFSPFFQHHHANRQAVWNDQADNLLKALQCFDGLKRFGGHVKVFEIYAGAKIGQFFNSLRIEMLPKEDPSNSYQKKKSKFNENTQDPKRSKRIQGWTDTLLQYSSLNYAKNVDFNRKVTRLIHLCQVIELLPNILFLKKISHSLIEGLYKIVKPLKNFLLNPSANGENYSDHLLINPTRLYEMSKTSINFSNGTTEDHTRKKKTSKLEIKQEKLPRIGTEQIKTKQKRKSNDRHNDSDIPPKHRCISIDPKEQDIHKEKGSNGHILESDSNEFTSSQLIQSDNELLKPFSQLSTQSLEHEVIPSGNMSTTSRQYDPEGETDNEGEMTSEGC